MVKQQKNTHQPTPTIPRTVRECPKERSQRRYRSGCKPRCPTAILSFLIPSRWPLRRRPQETETRPRMLTPSRRGSEAGGGRRRRWRRGEDRIGGGIWWGGGGDGVDVDAAAALYDFFFASLRFSSLSFFSFIFFSLWAFFYFVFLIIRIRWIWSSFVRGRGEDAALPTPLQKRLFPCLHITLT